MTDIHGDRDVYGNIVASFRIWWVAAFYIVAMMALGLHLYHGAWSSVRTLGYAKPSAESAAPARSRSSSRSSCGSDSRSFRVGVIAGIVR